MIEQFLQAATVGDIHDMNVRKHIVNTFIREVIYYTDKIIITLNFTETHDNYKITHELVENIEKQSQSETAFPIQSGSNMLTSSPPTKNALLSTKTKVRFLN